MRVKSTIFTIIISLLSLQFLSAQEAQLFEFKYKKDDNYRVLSTIEEDVYVNGRLNHHASIINRISVTVTDTTEDGRGVHSANFMASEESQGQAGTLYTWGNEYESIYTRDKQGKYTMGDQYFMPVVRDMPIFPKKAVAIGETWTEEGYEVQDLRRTFNIQTPFKAPFIANYKYEGPVNENGKTLHKISVNYSIQFDAPAQEKLWQYNDYPQTTLGHSQQNLYFDVEKGALDHYDETFLISIETVHGNVYRFKGKSSAKVTNFERTRDTTTVQNVQDKIKSLGLENVNVIATDKGLTFSIENIKFLADSAILQDSEQEKLKQIARIIEEYPNNDLLITGYTALAGSKESRKKLSDERAQSVAQFLISLGVKDKKQVFIQGLGAENPVAPSDTEENKARNRRVEITILDR
ncbi:MAG: OmpA family protein [Treponema sp.]|nr:OmpA family protein [Treponema sp.]